MLPILFREAALADLDEARDWYERQRRGLGDEFLDAVSAGIARVAEAPLASRVLYRDTRRLLLERFPYGLFYFIQDERVVIVLACVHAKRHPRTWRARR